MASPSSSSSPAIRAARVGAVAVGRLRYWAALVLAAVAAACGSGEAAKRPNVLLIVVDTLRWDALGCYGQERPTSPRIDELAASGVRFERAYSSAPWTMPAVASILTGLHPRAHTVTKVGRVLPDEVTTVAELFKQNGYSTSGIVSNNLVNAKSRLGQGFDTYNDAEARGHTWVSTDGVTKRAIRALETLSQREEPFFLSLLYFDPHYNYLDHESWTFAAASAGRLTSGESIGNLRKWTPTLTDAERAHVRDLYDEEVGYTDAGIGRLLSKLDELGLAGDTIVVLTADHGEEFWSHGWLGHTRTLYEDLVRVPLIVRDPRSPGGRVAAGPVSTVSITPTLVDLADLETGGARFQAPSLRGWLESDRPASDAPIFFDVAFEPVKGSNEEKRAHLRGVLRQGFKLIHDDEDGSERLFDLGADPGETRSVAGEHPELARELSALLERHAQVLSSGGPAASEVEPTADEIQALKDLGYAE